MSKDWLIDSHIQQILREQRSGLSDSVFKQLEETAKMQDLITPFKYEELFGNFTEPVALQQHFKSLLSFRDDLNKTLLPEGLFNGSFTVIAKEIEEASRSLAILPFERSALSDAIKSTQIDIANMFSVSALSSFLPSQNDLLSSISLLQADWPGREISVMSIEGMTGLMALENAISRAPFDASTSSALQSLLGSWDATKFSEGILNSWEERTKFYFDQGFDARLTSFPDVAYDRALFRSGLLRSDLYSPVYPAITEPDEDQEAEQEEEITEEAIVKRRMMDAYDLLFNLESQFREYLTEVMVERYGSAWIKQRVPGQTYAEWKEKRSAALSKGETEQPIISYADFTDYEKIIIRKDNWKEVFEADFRNQIDIQVSFQRLYPIRICTMHARPITKEDFLLLTVEVQRLLRAIRRLRDDA